jgi:hypothetical protein
MKLYCNMYDCSLIHPPYECDCFKNTASLLYDELYDDVCVRDMMKVYIRSEVE